MDRGISIIAIGDEVLHGVTLNTNATCIADALFTRGYFPVRHVVTSDDPKDIAEAIACELYAHREVITTGGLGPTSDDNTKAVVAQLFSRPLMKDQELFAELASRYGTDFPTLDNQSLLPQGALLFDNSVGTAPGFLLEDEKLFPGARLFVMPGPPHEMNDVFFHGVVPKFFPQKITNVQTFRFIGIGEHDLDPFLRSLQRQYPSLRVGIYPSYELVRVHLSVLREEEASVLQAAAAALKKGFWQNLLPEADTTLEGTVHTLLRSHGWKIATAESCTGGGICARLTSLSGSSEVVAGGVVAYQNYVKEALLGVPADVITMHGVVSTEVTESMAQGAQALFGVEVVCAVSGVFGPNGGTEDAPIGTVCATFLLPHKRVSDRFSFHGTREAIGERTIQRVLARLVMLLKKTP